MAKRAFIIGGTGQIGRSVALRLLTNGWNVTIAHRGIRDVPAKLQNSGGDFVVLDREQPGALQSALKDGVDAVIDTFAYDEAHAEQLLNLRNIGALVVMSSITVYRDAQGNTLDEASATRIPIMPTPILETHPTVKPGPQTYP